MSLAAPLQPELLRFSADQYARMIADGILPESSEYELLEGLIVRKDRGGKDDTDMGHSPRHRRAVRLLTKLAAKIDSPTRHLQIQLPIEATPTSTPEPDGAIILGSDDDFATRLPTASDTACVIEVADSSLSRDLHDKRDIYEHARIPQYVLVNLADDVIHVFTLTSNRYSAPTILTVNDTLTLALGNGETLPIPASDLLS